MGITEADFTGLPKVGQSDPGSAAQTTPSGLNESDFNNLPKTQAANFGTQEATPAAAPEGSNTFADKLAIFNHGFQSAAVGGLRLMNDTAGAIGGLIPGIGDSIKQGSARIEDILKTQGQKDDAGYKDAYARTPSPYTDFAGKLGAGIITGTPAILATGGAGMAAQGLASGASSGFIDNADSYKERGIKGSIGGIVGAALPGAAKGLGVVGNGIKTVVGAVDDMLPGGGTSSYISKLLNPKGAAKEDIAHAIQLDAGNNKVAAVNAIDNATPGLTPGEALGTGPASAIRQSEGGIKLNAKGKEEVADSLINRTNDTKAQLLNTVDSMNTPEIQANAKAGFDGMKNEFITKDGQLTNVAPDASYIPDVISGNKVLSNKYGVVLKTDAPGWNDAGNNSIEQLHKVKSLIGDDLNNANPNKITGQIATPLASNKQAELIAAQDKIRPVLEQSDNYKAAMENSHLQEIHDYYTQLLDSIKGQKGTGGEATLNQVTDTLVPNVLRSDKFIKDVAKAGNNPDDVQQLLNVAKGLKDSPLWKVYKGTEGGEGGPSGGIVGAAKDMLTNLTLGRYYNAMTKISLSKDWAPQIKDVLQSKTPITRQAKLLNLINQANNVGQNPVSAGALGAATVSGER